MSRNPHYIKMINSNKWKLLRAKKLQSNPVCEMCEANNRSTLGMRQLMFDYNNLESLCHSCHSDKHRRAFSHSKEAVQANNKRMTERFVDKFLK